LSLGQNTREKRERRNKKGQGVKEKKMSCQVHVSSVTNKIAGAHVLKKKKKKEVVVMLVV
jgi:hypothetical protein